MNYLIYGSGNAREHVTYLRLKTEITGNVYFASYAPNAFLANDENFFLVKNTTDAILLGRERNIDYALVLSPIDLLQGVVDIFIKAGFKTFGVNYKLAQLEGSKVYAKSLMESNKIQTPEYQVFHTFQKAKDFLEKNWRDKENEYVIKSDRFLINASLRVSLPQSIEEAIETLYFLMVTSGMQSGSRYVILERKVSGPEISSHVLFDGNNYLPFPIVQDYKKLYEGDEGPNTDGIASMATTKNILKSEDAQILEKNIIQTSLNAISSIGDYRFFLYTGIIKTKKGIQVLEYNTRPGNPEWSVLLPLLESSFEELLIYTLEGRLGNYQPQWKKDTVALSIMTTSSGYPFSEKEYNEKIHGLENLDKEIILLSDHTRKDDSQIYVNGGRVFGLSVLDENFDSARQKIYSNLERISFKGMFYRDDIAINGIVF